MGLGAGVGPRQRAVMSMPEVAPNRTKPKMSLYLSLRNWICPGIVDNQLSYKFQLIDLVWGPKRRVCYRFAIPLTVVAVSLIPSPSRS